MKKTVPGFFLLIAPLFFFQCNQKTKPKESIRIQQEEAGLSSTSPMVDWIKTMVVAPFRKPFSSPAQTSIFYKELTDCIVSHLAGAKELKVLLPSSAKILEREKEKADYGLSGESESMDGNFVLTCRLSDLRRGTRLWEKTFTGESRFLFQTAKAISDSVLNRLNMKVGFSVFPSDDPPPEEVFDDYLEGKRYFEKNNHIAADLAVQNFKKVLRADSAFIPAWVGLGETYLRIPNNGWDRNSVWFHLAQQTAFKALQMDSSCADARLILAKVYYGLSDLRQAEQQFRKALAVNPSMPDAWFGLGMVLSEYGLYLPGLDVLNRALELDPALSRASIGKAMVLIGLKHYAEADEELKQALELQPEVSELHAYLALVRCYQNDLNGAQKEIQKSFEKNDAFLFAHVVQAMLYAKQGKMDSALGELELNVIPSLHNDAGLSVAVAAVYALLNRPGLSVQWLERAQQWGYKQYPWLENDSNFKSIRNDERFIDILNRVRKEWEKRTQESG